MEIEVLLLIFGLFLLIMGILGVFVYSDSNISNAPEPIKSMLSDFGDWKYWSTLIGFILVIGAGYYAFDNLRKRREFSKLLDTDSKAKFIKNQERLEFLAWTLTSEHEKEIWRKKKEFKIK